MLCKGFFRRRSHDFEHTRAICYHIAAVNRDPKKPFPSIAKYWPLPTDDDGQLDDQTEYKRLKGILAQYKQGKLNQK